MSGCTNPEIHSENGGPMRYCPCGWMETSEPTESEYVRGLRAAREVVARQTDLTELVHFDRPSDFRKGVLTCLAALDAKIAEDPS